MHATSRAILGVISSIIAFTTRLLIDEAEARKSPVLRSPIDGIGVGAAFEPGKELDPTGAAAETHARFEAAGPLHAAAGDGGIDPDELAGTVGEDADVRIDRPPQYDVGVAGPRVVDERSLHDAAGAPLQIDGAARRRKPAQRA